jgi:hypothetical protein
VIPLPKSTGRLRRTESRGHGGPDRPSGLASWLRRGGASGISSIRAPSERVPRRRCGPLERAMPRRRAGQHLQVSRTVGQTEEQSVNLAVRSPESRSAQVQSQPGLVVESTMVYARADRHGRRPYRAPAVGQEQLHRRPHRDGGRPRGTGRGRSGDVWITPPSAAFAADGCGLRFWKMSGATANFLPSPPRLAPVGTIVDRCAGISPIDPR